MSALPSPSTRRAAAGQPRARRRPNLRVVGPPRNTARYVVALLVLGAAGVFGIVSLSALAAEAAFAERSLGRDVAGLTYHYEELTAEIAELSSPARVRATAVGELGMVPAEEAAYLVVDAPLDGPVRPAAAEGDMVPASYVVADPVKQALGSGG